MALSLNAAHNPQVSPRGFSTEYLYRLIVVGGDPFIGESLLMVAGNSGRLQLGAVDCHTARRERHPTLEQKFVYYDVEVDWGK